MAKNLTALTQIWSVPVNIHGLCQSGEVYCGGVAVPSSIFSQVVNTLDWFSLRIQSTKPSVWPINEEGPRGVSATAAYPKEQTWLLMMFSPEPRRPFQSWLARMPPKNRTQSDWAECRSEGGRNQSAFRRKSPGEPPSHSCQFTYRPGFTHMALLHGEGKGLMLIY